jgi:hypothetical protein
MSADMLEKSMRQLCFAGHNARFLTGMPMTLLVATGVVQICEAVVDVDESTWNAPAPSGHRRRLAPRPDLPRFRHP